MRKLVVFVLSVLIVFGCKCSIFAGDVNDTYVKSEYVEYAVRLAEEYDNPSLTPYLIVAMIEKESTGRPAVVSRAGAIGLMQILPKYHTARMRKLRVTNLKDPYGNMKVGVNFVDELLRKYDGNVYAALMYYNGGYYGARNALRGKYSIYAKGITSRAAELNNDVFNKKYGLYEEDLDVHLEEEKVDVVASSNKKSVKKESKKNKKK